MKEGDKVYFVREWCGKFKLETSTIKSVAPKSIILHTEIGFKRRYRKDSGILKPSFEEAKERLVKQYNERIKSLYKKVETLEAEREKAWMLTEDSFTEGG